MKKTLGKKYLGALVLGLMVIAACDSMTGSTDVAGDKLQTSAFDLPSFATGVDEVGIAGVFIDDIDDLELSAAQLAVGFEVDITGYVGYLTGSSPAHPKLKELLLEVEKDDSGIWGEIGFWDDDELVSVVLSARGDAPGREFTELDTDFNQLTISSIGSYKVKASAVFTRQGAGNDEADGTESFLVTELIINVEFPAAPAIAARILKANEVDARYGSGRTGGNYISDVAKQMGPGTNFNGETKADGDNMNRAYWDAVWEYLRDETGEDLDEKPEGYIW